MADSFGLVENKIQEAAFFLHQMRQTNYLSFEASCFFSAFVSAARSVTFVLQTCMSGVDGFKEWYEHARESLKTDPLAPYFVEVRNDILHTGRNPLNQVTLEHLRDSLHNQLHHHEHSHVLVIPTTDQNNKTVLVDALQACESYFTSLVSVVYDCYYSFRTIVDSQWYFTEESFTSMGKTFEDAIVELGFPSSWAACCPLGSSAWKVLRSQQPSCLINSIFSDYLGKTIPGPDEDIS